MLTKPLLDLAAQMAPSVKNWPRRQPGLLIVDGKVLRYADFHSLFHQIRQLFADNLYSFRSNKKDPMILDCGAHVGLASLYFKEHYPAARIKAFEADAAITELCRANLEAFGAADVELVHAAVWTHGDGVRFTHSNDDAGSVGETKDARLVPSVRLKSILAEGPVDFLKLDVEGAEFPLFADCGEDLKRVTSMAVEVHAMGGEQARIGDLLQTLEALGFRYVLGDLHAATWLPPLVPPPFGYVRTERFIISIFAWQERP
jgi:FkbM family methyltransferase